MGSFWRYHVPSGRCIPPLVSISSILAKCGVTLALLMRLLMNAAATSALGLPTSADRKRNWRLRFETSIVSMSITWMLRKPLSACARVAAAAAAAVEKNGAMSAAWVAKWERVLCVFVFCFFARTHEAHLSQSWCCTARKRRIAWAPPGARGRLAKSFSSSQPSPPAPTTRISTISSACSISSACIVRGGRCVCTLEWGGDPRKPPPHQAAGVPWLPARPQAAGTTRRPRRARGRRRRRWRVSRGDAASRVCAPRTQ